jgi:hypothetical protein
MKAPLCPACGLVCSVGKPQDCGDAINHDCRCPVHGLVLTISTRKATE